MRTATPARRTEPRATGSLLTPGEVTIAGVAVGLVSTYGSVQQAHDHAVQQAAEQPHPAWRSAWQKIAAALVELGAQHGAPTGGTR